MLQIRLLSFNYNFVQCFAQSRTKASLKMMKDKHEEVCRPWYIPGIESFNIFKIMGDSRT